MRIGHIRNNWHTYSKPIFHPGFVLSDELPAGPFSLTKPTGETLPKDTRPLLDFELRVHLEPLPPPMMMDSEKSVGNPGTRSP